MSQPTVMRLGRRWVDMKDMKILNIHEKDGTTRELTLRKAGDDRWVCVASRIVSER